MKRIVSALLVCVTLIASLTACSLVDNMSKKSNNSVAPNISVMSNKNENSHKTEEVTTEKPAEKKTEETKSFTQPTTVAPETQPQSQLRTPEITSNSISKVNLKSGDSEIESYYPNHAYHPKIVDLGKKWRGYRYWISYTPYPNSKDYYENPHVVASNDLINYSEIKFEEPALYNHKKSTRYNSDSHLVYNDDLDRLELFWRYTDYESNYMAMYMRYSYDGNEWSESVTVYETYNREKEDMISPALIYDSGTYKVWYVNKYKMYYREYTNGVWGVPVDTKIKFADNSFIWHVDVIETTDGYEMIACACIDKKDRRHMSLYYSTASNETNWSVAQEVVKPSADVTSWDGGGLYRSSFIKSDGMYFVLYSGRNDYNDFGTGLLFGKDMFNLKGTDIDYINNSQKSAAEFWRYVKNF